LWERVDRISEAKFETGEGFFPHGKVWDGDRDPSSGADCVHATFSHKGRREEPLKRSVGYVR